MNCKRTPVHRLPEFFIVCSEHRTCAGGSEHEKVDFLHTLPLGSIKFEEKYNLPQKDEASSNFSVHVCKLVRRWQHYLLAKKDLDFKEGLSASENEQYPVIPD